MVVSIKEFPGAVVICVPLRKTLYPTTPMLSVLAVQLKLTWLEATAVAVRLVGAVGGVLSVVAP